MHGIAKRGLALAAATSGLVLGTAGIAAADATAAGEVSHSGGIVAGNQIQVPANVPINLCGDQVNVIAALNLNAPAKCKIDEGDIDATATGEVEHSGGIIAGNQIQVPLTVPVNACGDQVNVIALLNLNGPAKCKIS